MKEKTWMYSFNRERELRTKKHKIISKNKKQKSLKNRKKNKPRLKKSNKINRGKERYYINALYTTVAFIHLAESFLFPYSFILVT